jgi:hypothetical protein
MWFSLFLMVVSSIIQAALAPKPQAPKAASLGEFDIPTAQEGTSIAVAFGTVVITGANCVWYGDLGKKAIKSKKGKK